jgi:predicted metal-dependent enzyme (double-stranded beta helix superfamily)
MCSRSGQATTIHDHGGSSCAFKILKGVASETFFKRVPGARGYQGYVTPTGASKLYKYGQVCSIPDGEIYRIANNQTGQDLITLHLYSPPSQMSLFEVYNPQKGPPVDQIKSARLVNLSI